MRALFLLLLSSFVGSSLFAQQAIAPADTRLLGNRDGSFELYVRKVGNVNSILLTDTSTDPNAYADNYSLRAYEWGPTYGDQQRILDGKILTRNPPLYFLMTSTAAPVARLGEGEWFHIHLPASVIYGYPWGREGQFEMKEGTWFNIRAFTKPMADYSGAYKDNPFVIAKPGEKPKPIPVPATDGGSIGAIAASTGGLFLKPTDDADMLKEIDALIDPVKNSAIDVVFVIDTTLSMKVHMDAIKNKLTAMLVEKSAQAKAHSGQLRVGLVKYRDYYGEEYLTQATPFTDDIDAINAEIKAITTAGGHDIPEAVWEGNFAALNEFKWQSHTRIVIQMGDAPPHERPVGKITQQMVVDKANQLAIRIHGLMLRDPPRR